MATCRRRVLIQGPSEFWINEQSRRGKSMDEIGWAKSLKRADVHFTSGSNDFGLDSNRFPATFHSSACSYSMVE